MLFALLLTLGIGVLSFALRSYQTAFAQKCGALGILIALGGLFLRLNTIAFGEPVGPTAKADASPEDLQYHIYVRQKIQQGLDDVDAGRTISHAEVQQRLAKWLTA